MLAALGSGVSAQEIVSTGYSFPTYPTVAPGQVITVFVRGLNLPDAAASGLPLPRSLGGVTVRVRNTSNNPDYPERLPIFSLRSYDSCASWFSRGCSLTGVTVQVPAEPPCVPTGDAGPNECTIGPHVILLAVEENGAAGPDFPVIVAVSRPQILNACQTIFGGIGGTCEAFVTHADGTRMTGQQPAHPGETIVIYATGLGPTDAQAIRFLYGLTIRYQLELPPASPPPPPLWTPHQGWVFPSYVGLVPGFVGLYQINATLPEELPPRVAGCGGFAAGTNTRIAIGAGDSGSADGSSYADICVEP